MLLETALCEGPCCAAVEAAPCCARTIQITKATQGPNREGAQQGMKPPCGPAL